MYRSMDEDKLLLDWRESTPEPTLASLMAIMQRVDNNTKTHKAITEKRLDIIKEKATETDSRIDAIEK